MTEPLAKDDMAGLACGGLNRGGVIGRDAAVLQPMLDVLALDLGGTQPDRHRSRCPAEHGHGFVDSGFVFHGIVTGSKLVGDSARKQDCAQGHAKSLAMKSLAELVAEHRASLGMNPAEYARYVGTSRQNINNVEAGGIKQPSYIGKLAKAMCTSVDALLAGRAGPWEVAQPVSHDTTNLRVLPEPSNPPYNQGREAGRVSRHQAQ